MRTTVMRLDRAPTHGGAGVTAIQELYEELAEAVVLAARDLGYHGADPFGAIGHLRAPSGALLRIGRSTRELWDIFFGSFREDERAHEAEASLQATVDIREELDQAGDLPDEHLIERMLAALANLFDSRLQSANERMDALIEDLGDHQRDLGSAQLQEAYQSDDPAQSQAHHYGHERTGL